MAKVREQLKLRYAATVKQSFCSNLANLISILMPVNTVHASVAMNIALKRVLTNQQTISGAELAEKLTLTGSLL